MNRKSLYEIGACWIFQVKVKNDLDVIEDLIFKSRFNAILISDIFDLPFAEGNMCVILYRCYSRSAYDLYHKLHGEHIRVIDPVIVQGILSSVSYVQDHRVIYLNFDMSRKV